MTKSMRQRISRRVHGHSTKVLGCCGENKTPAVESAFRLEKFIQEIAALEFERGLAEGMKAKAK